MQATRIPGRSPAVNIIRIGKEMIPIRKYLSQFGFKGASQQKKASELSGGERNRCQLAKVLKTGGNLLLLDEPTNDLDVNTLRMLEEAILDFLLATPSPRSCGLLRMQRAPSTNGIMWFSSPITAAGPRWIFTTFPFRPSRDGHRQSQPI